MEKEKEKIAYKAHCLVLTYPSVGHMNPLLQFSKRLEHKGVKVTLVTTNFIYNTMNISTTNNISVAAISDGYDDGGIQKSESPEAYLERFRRVGSETLTRVVEKLSGSGHGPVDCIVYDAFLPWALDVAKNFGLVGAVFFTLSCAVDSIYYHVNRGLLKVPGSDSGSGSDILLPGLPPLESLDLPSYIYDPEKYPAFLSVVVDQFSNVDKVDCVLCNTFYELEQEVVDWMRKILPLSTVGPTIPSIYLDKRLEGDKQYGLSLSNPNREACMEWLNSRPKRSVVYVSSGSLVDLEAEQMKELASALTRSNSYFLWVVRTSEADKLPKGFTQETITSEKGLVVAWSPQIDVLANDAVGCFITHCGWNSTDVWKIGVRAPADERGIVRGEDLEKCLKEREEKR